MDTAYYEQILLDYKKPTLHSLNALYYERIGHYILPKNHYVKRQTPKFYMILICTDGKGVYRCGDYEYKIQKNDIFFCFPDIYTYYQSSEENPWSLYWAHFNGTDVLKLLERLDARYDNAVFSSNHIPSVYPIFNTILSHPVELLTDEEYMLCQTYFQQIIWSVIRLLSKTDTMPTPIVDAVHYFNHNITKKLSVDELASHVNLSKYYFAHMFKEHMGLSPNQYMIKAKMNMAKTLLLTSQLSISDISKMLGFENAFYFSNQFKKVVGVSPTTFRQV